MTQINREESCTPVSSDNPTQLVTKGKGNEKSRKQEKQKKGEQTLTKTKQQQKTLYYNSIQHELTTFNGNYGLFC